MKIFSFLFVFTLIAIPLSPTHWDQAIVWNVGQGQWVTFSNPLYCHHIDMGGEKAPWATIIKACSGKKNTLSITHYDWDHINFIPRAKSHLKNLCLLNHPPHKPRSAKKKRALASLKLCSERIPELQRLKFKPQKVKKENARSLIYFYRGWLVPGDSEKPQERIWHRLLPFYEVHYLVLGHHGSNTSTGKILLSHLPKLRLALASAREGKYGHPHKKVAQRLKNKGTPLLTTEAWGTLRLRF